MAQTKSTFSLAGWRVLLCAVGSFALAGALAGCVGKPEVKQGKGASMPVPIEQVLRTHRDEWLAIPGVVGTAISRHAGEPCILVLVAHRTREIAARIPRKVDGYPLVIEESGRFRALPDR